MTGVPAVSDWSSLPHSDIASGDQGPWGAWIPRAWHAVADPAGRHLAPPEPVLMTDPDAGLDLYHAELIAYWGPLLHLLVFGLGWGRPDLGLERWQKRGRPVDDPVLAVVNRWWGRYVPDILATGPLLALMAQAGGLHDRATRPGTDVVVDGSRHAAYQRDPVWQAIWNRIPELHLAHHANTPMGESPQTSSGLVVGSDDAASAVLIRDRYAGWYAALRACGLAQTTRGSSWRVDVVVKPLGWLGTYRLSKITGVWFSGRHRWHELGW
jgi:hypothetical protein